MRSIAVVLALAWGAGCASIPTWEQERQPLCDWLTAQACEEGQQPCVAVACDGCAAEAITVSEPAIRDARDQCVDTFWAQRRWEEEPCPDSDAIVVQCLVSEYK